MKLGLIDVALVIQDQDEQVIIDALVEQIKALQEENKGATQRIKGLEAIKVIYLNTINTLMEAAKEQEAQIKELKQNSRAAKYFEMAEENLRMATELEQLKQKVELLIECYSEQRKAN